MLLATLWPKKRACLTPEKVEACVIVKSNLGLLRDMGFRNKWEVNVWLIDWFLLASQNQWLLFHVEYYLLKNQLDFWESQDRDFEKIPGSRRSLLATGFQDCRDFYLKSECTPSKLCCKNIQKWFHQATSLCLSFWVKFAKFAQKKTQHGNLLLYLLLLLVILRFLWKMSRFFWPHSKF